METESDHPSSTDLPEVSSTLCFDDLDVVIEQTHVRLSELMEASPDHVTALLHVQLAVHEWLANLVQHADFKPQQIRIEVEIVYEGDGFRCTISDSSSGFDVDEQVELRRTHLAALPERGMGLLMVFACATDLVYAREQQGNTLSFRVLDDGGDRCLAIPF